MYFLRTLSFHDVVRALKRREPRLALHISGNLCSNVLNTVRADLGRRSQHLLVQVVDLAVLDLEVAPEPAPQPACLGTALGLGGRENMLEGQSLFGRQGPFAHLRVRRGRQVHPPERGLEPVGQGVGGMK